MKACRFHCYLVLAEDELARPHRDCTILVAYMKEKNIFAPGAKLLMGIIAMTDHFYKKNK